MINSLSKTYAMTGWRVGYCAGPEAIIRAMLLVLQQSSRGPATFVQDAAACALTSDQECVTRMAAEYQARRDRVVERLRGIPGVEPLVPEGGLFVMVDVRGLGKPSDDVRRFLLRDAGVVVIHGSAYGPGGEGTLARLVRGGRRDPRARPRAAPRGAASRGWPAERVAGRLGMSLTELPVIDRPRRAGRRPAGAARGPRRGHQHARRPRPIGSAGRSTRPTPASTRSSR